MLLCSAACGEGSQRDEYPLSLQDGPPKALLDSSAMAGLDEDTAKARFKRVMLLSDAYRAAQADPNMRQLDDPEGRAFRARAALARLWLTEVFEPDNGPSTLPQDAYKKEREKLSRGRTSMICQVILSPKGLEDEARTQRSNSVEFRELVQGHADEIAALARQFVTAKPRRKPCEVFNRVARTYAGRNNQNIPEGVEFRIEGAAMEACREDLWVKPWVDAVCPVEGFATLDPVWTDYGAHVITVLKISPASTLSAQELDLLARERATSTWRVERLAAELERLAQRFDVGVSKDLSAP